MDMEPQKEHQWLQKFVGEWTYESDALEGQDQPAEQMTGTERVRSLGGFWIVAEGQGSMPGGEVGTTMMTVGYDPQKQRYVGTYIGSMMNYLWVYDGELDADARVLTLAADGPAFDGSDNMAKYRDVTEFKSDDHRVFTSSVQGADGAWHQFMTINYRRKK